MSSRNTNTSLDNVPILFAPFPELPNELQDEIFKLLLPTKGNVITIKLDPKRSSEKREVKTDKGRMGSKYTRASYRIPAIAQICRASRCIFRRHYSYIFKSQLDNKPVWFHSKKDLLHFENVNALINFYKGVLPHNSKVQYDFLPEFANMHHRVENVAVNHLNFRGKSVPMVGQTFNAYKKLKLLVAGGDFDEEGLEDWATGYKGYSENKTWKPTLPWKNPEEKSEEKGNVPDFEMLSCKQFKEFVENWE